LLCKEVVIRIHANQNLVSRAGTRPADRAQVQKGHLCKLNRHIRKTRISGLYGIVREDGRKKETARRRTKNRERKDEVAADCRGR
jgi:hypothetical protein